MIVPKILEEDVYVANIIKNAKIKDSWSCQRMNVETIIKFDGTL